MRNALLPYVAWLGVLQSSAAVGGGIEDFARLIGVASVLGTLTVLIYRLGVWRQEMENTRNNVGAQVRAHRDESATNFDRIERRLEALDHVLAAAAESQHRARGWQARTERRLRRLEAERSG